ncbi:MAG: hypothetical protein ACPGWR_18025 [Ardenticatenaceae bacterium]
MQIDKEEMSHVGAVRGRNVYELTSRRQLVTGASNSLDNVLKQRFVNPMSPYRLRAHDAHLRLAAGGGYELWIPASGTSPGVHVPIHFDAKPAPLTGGIHGAEQGPAQYKLTRDATGWQAKIEIDESLHRRDVLFTIGHELDEIALIVRANPSDDAAILAEGRASLFKPGSLVTTLTAHDRAAARELCAQWQDLQQPPRGTTATGVQKRSDRLARMIDAMGLSESTNLFDKFHVLRKEGAPDGLLRRVGVPEELTRYRNSAQFRALRASWPSFSSIVDNKLISHLMIPSDPGRRLFWQAGIKGGHHDKLLHDFVDSHPQYIIVKEAEKLVGGLVYRKYSQYRWKGSGPKPLPHDSRFPKPGDAGAGTSHSDWVLAKRGGVALPKTTFENLLSFLVAADEAWYKWYDANSVKAHSGFDEQFTHFSMFAGIELTGFFDYILPDQFRLRTVFVEASWF